jgi:hypothetical protein
MEKRWRPSATEKLSMVSSSRKMTERPALSEATP